MRVEVPEGVRCTNQVHFLGYIVFCVVVGVDVVVDIAVGVCVVVEIFGWKT